MSSQNTDDRIFDLLDRWAIAQRNAQEISVADLCREHPELMPEVDRRIEALKSTTWLDQQIDKNETNEKNSPFDFGLPQHLGRYELLMLLGAGGHGQVWKGFDPELQRHVAIKIPRPDRAIWSNKIEFFAEEARRLAQLKHPRIVTIFDVGIHDDYCYIVSEYIDGKNLAEVIARQDKINAVELIAEIAECLDYAHKQGFIHRDVKPSNILLDLQSRPYLTDFGIAISTQELATTIQRQVGTQSYMSPEQARGGPLDHRTDVFSLGVVLYQLFAKELPCLKTPDNDYSTTSTSRSSIPAGIAQICEKALAFDPDARYSSAQAMADDLRKYAKPRWQAWKILGIILLVAVSIYGAWNWFFTQDVKAIQQQAAPTISRGQEAFDETIRELRQAVPPSVNEKAENRPSMKRPSLNFPSLKTAVDLSGQELTDDDYDRLGSQRMLTSLNLAATTTNDTQLASLKSILSLRTLNLSGTSITDAGLRHLTALPSIQKLALDGTKITNAGLKHIGELRLQQLSLSRTETSKEGIKHLSNQYGTGGHLRELDLSHTSVTDEAIAYLQKIPKLKSLNLQGTKFTQQGIENLKTLLPECEVQQ